MGHETVKEKINAGYYETKLPYEYVKVPVDEDRMTVRQAREHEAAQELAKQAHRLNRRADIARLELEFRNDLAAEYNLMNHPKELKLWNLAYQYGHDAGFKEIAIYYDEFAELVG
jgi:hypothetical protein